MLETRGKQHRAVQASIIQTVGALGTQKERGINEHWTGRARLLGEVGHELHLKGFGRYCRPRKDLSKARGWGREWPVWELA